MGGPSAGARSLAGRVRARPRDLGARNVTLASSRDSKARLAGAAQRADRAHDRLLELLRALRADHHALAVRRLAQHAVVAAGIEGPAPRAETDAVSAVLEQRVV